MKPTVFIHTNEKQWVGAKVAEYSIRKASPNREKFAISILRLEDHDALCGREGQTYLRDRRPTLWRNGDLQSFTPLRFLPPQLMNYEGRTVVIDPDVFALSDIYELLTRDMKGKAIICKPVYTAAGRFRYHASSVMLLDCSRLRHWRWQDQIEEMFTGKRDYRQWIWLLLEPSENIGPLEAEWNHFDRLDENTKLLHNTQRLTQPWKTGLPIDFTRTKNTLPQGRKWGILPRSWLVQNPVEHFVGLAGSISAASRSRSREILFFVAKRMPRGRPPNRESAPVGDREKTSPPRHTLAARNGNRFPAHGSLRALSGRS